MEFEEEEKTSTGRFIPQKARDGEEVGVPIMREHRRVLVTREEIARAGGVRAAVEEALSLAALQMTPRALTAYEAVGMAPSETDGANFLLKVEVENEEELREALAAGAEAVALLKMNKEDARQLCELAKTLRANIRVES